MEKQQAPPPRPHWRRRDPLDAEVYVVHPTQFRSVVQQLTGAPPGAAHDGAAQPQRGGGGKINTSHQDSKNINGSGGRGTGTTLGQMYEDCIAWAAQDDHHDQRT